MKSQDKVSMDKQDGATSYSTTRWWSKWEVLKQMLGYFGDIPSFLQDGDLPPTRLKLVEIIKLQMELAVTIDAGPVVNPL